MASEIREDLNLPYEFTLGEKTFRARALDLNEEVELEDAIGTTIDEIKLDSAKVKRQILWMVLRQTEPQITMKEVGALASLADRETINMIVLSGFAGKERAEELLADEDEDPLEDKPDETSGETALNKPVEEAPTGDLLSA